MKTASEPPITRLKELVDDRTVFLPLTVEQYHRMIAAGLLPEGEPYELLDGLLVRKDRSAAGKDPMTVGHEHATAIAILMDLNPRLRRLGCYIRIQQPVTLPPWDEPEPDGAVVLGKLTDYTDRHPGAADLTCVIEVSDSSLRRDRTTKLRIYAGSGIARYIIINLPDRVVEVYTQPMNGNGGTPRYGQSVTLSGRQGVEIPAARGRRLSVPARNLLP